MLLKIWKIITIPIVIITWLIFIIVMILFYICGRELEFRYKNSVFTKFKKCIRCLNTFNIKEMTTRDKLYYYCKKCLYL